MSLAARQSLKASAVRRSFKALRSCQAWPPFPFPHLTAQIPFSTPTPELVLLQQSEISRHLAPNASEALLHSLCQDNSPQAVTIGGLEAAISTCTQGMDGRALQLIAIDGSQSKKIQKKQELLKEGLLSSTSQTWEDAIDTSCCFDAISVLGWAHERNFVSPQEKVKGMSRYKKQLL